jgi:hypothetical protein
MASTIFINPGLQSAPLGGFEGQYRPLWAGSNRAFDHDQAAPLAERGNHGQEDGVGTVKNAGEGPEVGDPVQHPEEFSLMGPEAGENPPKGFQIFIPEGSFPGRAALSPVPEVVSRQFEERIVPERFNEDGSPSRSQNATDFPGGAVKVFNMMEDAAAVYQVDGPGDERKARPVGRDREKPFPDTVRLGAPHRDTARNG